MIWAHQNGICGIFDSFWQFFVVFTIPPSESNLGGSYKPEWAFQPKFWFYTFNSMSGYEKAVWKLTNVIMGFFGRWNWSNLLSLLGSSASWWLLCTKYISGKVGKAFNSWQTVTKCPWKLGNQSFSFRKSRNQVEFGGKFWFGLYQGVPFWPGRLYTKNHQKCPKNLEKSWK